MRASSNLDVHSSRPNITPRRDSRACVTKHGRGRSIQPNGASQMSLSTSSESAATLVAGHDGAAEATVAARRRAFRALHERGWFLIPNPWDVGSARYLQHLGFPALATTSAGFAFSQGLPDSGDDGVLGCDRSLAYIASITAAVDLPVTADFMSGYGREPEDVAASVARCVATGVAGLSIEDATGDPKSPLYELSIAVERVRAARQAIDRSGEDVLLTARAECYHVGHPDPFRESVQRLKAYAAAGADVLFAPGPHNPEIGRASCRERVDVTDVDVCGEK